MPVVMDYLRAHPQVSLRTLLVDRVVNLLDEGVDVAVRIGALPDSTLTAVPVGHVRRVVCASPVPERHGVPQEPDALTRYCTITAAMEGRGRNGASCRTGNPAAWTWIRS